MIYERGKKRYHLSENLFTTPILKNGKHIYFWVITGYALFNSIKTYQVYYSNIENTLISGILLIFEK